MWVTSWRTIKKGRRARDRQGTQPYTFLLWFILRVFETSAMKVKRSQWTCGTQTGWFPSTRHTSSALPLIFLLISNLFAYHKRVWGLETSLFCRTIMCLYNVYISRPTRCTNSYNESLLIIKCSTCFGLLSQTSGVTFLKLYSYGISRYVWLLFCYSHTTVRRMVPAYTKYDVQLIKVAPEDGLI